MKITVKENRELICESEMGTQNENNVQELEIQVPEKYEYWNKKIVFVTENDGFWDNIINNKYIIKNNLTSYEKLKFYIWLTHEDKDFRSVEKTIIFYKNTNVDDQITEEELGSVNRVMEIVEAEIEQNEKSRLKLVELTEKIQQKLDEGEFKGEKGETGERGADGQPGKDGKNGVDGKDGKNGTDGVNGYTPIKGIDYFDGENGTDGQNGQDGYTPIKGIDYFDGKNGTDGQPGRDGYTPVKGLDYYTEAEKQELITEIIDSIPRAEDGEY